MKQANIVLLLGVVAVAVFFKIATRKTVNPSATGGTPVDPMDASEHDPITEAAYHQGASDFAPAAGADENTDGAEVTSLQ